MKLKRGGEKSKDMYDDDKIKKKKKKNRNIVSLCEKID